jgi:Asp/Glu/hydantoin racemase
MRILIANPNMNETMTSLMVAEARACCRPDTEISGLSAEFGVAYIATRAEMAIAGYALLDGLAKNYHDHDAVIIGAFCHSFVDAAKELVPLPVIGIAEAGMRAAQIFGKRVGLISVGAPGRAANEETVAGLGMQADVVSVRLLDLSGTDLANDQIKADGEVIKLGRRMVAEEEVDVLVLGGAAFAEMAGRIANELPVPVISPIPFAIAFAEQAVLGGWQVPTVGSFAQPGAKATAGLSSPLAEIFKARPT